jgi:hypothetical protein
MLQIIRNLFHKTRQLGTYVGTFRTCDSAFTFRMLTGFPGTVNRTHPASIEPCLVDSNAPVTSYGTAVLIDSVTQGARPFSAADTTTPVAPYGIGARPYPIQQQTGGMTATIGTSAPPSTQPLDVLKSGYILAYLNNFAVNNAVKNGPVYIRIAASAGQHVQGGFEALADMLGTNTVLVSNAYFNGPAGPDGVVEIGFNL